MTETRTLSIAGVRVVIRADAGLLAALATRWSQVPAPSPSEARGLEIAYEVAPAAQDEVVVRRDGVELYTACPLDARQFLELDVYREVAHATPSTALHAAALARGGRAALLVGASGAGKSSLALALAGRGWAYMGDEHAFLDDALAVSGLPRAVRVGEELAEALPGRVEAGVVPVGLVALLGARRGRAPEASPVTGAAAAVALLGSLHRRPRAEDMRRVAALVAAAPVVRLAVEGLDAQADALERAWTRR